ncbi:MAG: universal stress protein [Pseudomonadota bacterium]|nr:universal stress protein [Pseudomonadota bacterium]
MAYQTVLVHLDLDPHCAARVARAATVVAPGGVLVGVAMSGVSRLLYRSAPAPDSDQYLALHRAFLRERASAALAAFMQHAARAHMPACEGRLIDDEVASGLSLEARVADVLVLTQPEPSSDLLAQLLPHAGRPVLVLPAALMAPTVMHQHPRRILVAWDASREAGRALASALPLLRQADIVDLVVCETDAASRVAQDVQMADPLPWLARHGVQATLRHHPLESSPLFRRDAVGEALLTVSRDGEYDLMVMGAYTHSRLRETFLSGVTRTVLAHMTVPVLLEH